MFFIIIVVVLISPQGGISSFVLELKLIYHASKISRENVIQCER